MKSWFQAVLRTRNYCAHLVTTLIMMMSMEVKVGRFIVVFK